MIGGVFNTAGAIMGAAAHLGAGDVILIELQATGPNGKYVAMQYWDDVFSAIQAATAKGITVVEAAGNGNENFDLPIFAGTGLQRIPARSSSVLDPPTNFFDYHGFGAGTSYAKIGVPRSRIWFSNYGRIVNVHGWGWHVTTCGYGDAGWCVGEPLVHAPVLRHLERLADRHRRRGGAAGHLESAQWRAAHAGEGARHPDVDRHAAGRRAGRAAFTQRIGPLPNLAKAEKLV